MKIVQIEGSKIQDNQSLHLEFKNKLDFPDYYGMNWNAFIDCLSDFSELQIDFQNTEDFAKRLPELFAMLVACVADVNTYRKRNVLFKFL